MTNAEIAAFLRELAALVELKGESIFKVRAYQDVANLFDSSTEDIAALAAQGRLRSLPGVGEAIANKVAELVTTGHSSYLNRYLAELPPGLADLRGTPGVSPGTLHRIYVSLKASSLDDVERAAVEHRIAKLPRIPTGAEQAILETIRQVRASKAAAEG